MDERFWSDMESARISTYAMEEGRERTALFALWRCMTVIAERFGLEEKTVAPKCESGDSSNIEFQRATAHLYQTSTDPFPRPLRVGDRVKYKGDIVGTIKAPSPAKEDWWFVRFDPDQRFGAVHCPPSSLTLIDDEPSASPSPLTDEELAKAAWDKYQSFFSHKIPWDSSNELPQYDKKSFIAGIVEARRLLDDAKDDTIRRLFAERAEAIQNARKDERERCCKAVADSRTDEERREQEFAGRKCARLAAIKTIRALDSSDAIMQDGNKQ